MENEFASVKNEAKLLDIEVTLESSTSDVFQDNVHDMMLGYLPEKLEQSDVDEINNLYNRHPSA